MLSTLNQWRINGTKHVTLNQRIERMWARCERARRPLPLIFFTRRRTEASCSVSHRDRPGAWCADALAASGGRWGIPFCLVGLGLAIRFS
jgi:hypothetical protein